MVAVQADVSGAVQNGEEHRPSLRQCRGEQDIGSGNPEIGSGVAKVALGVDERGDLSSIIECNRDFDRTRAGHAIFEPNKINCQGTISTWSVRAGGLGEEPVDPAVSPEVLRQDGTLQNKSVKRSAAAEGDVELPEIENTAGQINK